MYIYVNLFFNRFWITQRRCEKTLQHLPATPHEKLPLSHHPDHPMSKISRHRMFVQLHRHPTVILVIIVKKKKQFEILFKRKKSYDF